MGIRFRQGYVAALAAMVCALLGSCTRERGSYEAEIKEFCFVKRIGVDTMIRLSTDTVRPQSTEVQVTVVSGSDLKSIVPWFTLSPGAKADKEVGKAYNASEGFAVKVTSENGRVTRTYHFAITVEESIGSGTKRKADSVFLNGDAYIENVRLEEFANVAPRQVGKRIYFEVPEGTDITKLTPTFEVAKGATTEFASGTPYNFTDPLYVRVTSEDKRASVGYIIYVRVAGPLPCSEARIWDFRFDETLAKSVMQGSSIYIAIESGLDITNLTPRYERSDGALVDVPSGKPHDFSKPVKITVRSQNRNAKSVYTVTVEQVKNSEANIIDFSIREVRGGKPTYRADRSICYYLTDEQVSANSITPLFSISKGATLSAEGIGKLISGKTYDFTNVKRLTVTSEDGASQRTYDFELITGKENKTGWMHQPHLKFTSFDFLSPQCIVPPVLMDGQIVCIVPHGTNLTKLIPVFTLGTLVLPSTLHLSSTKAEIKSGETKIDCSKPVNVYVRNGAETKQHRIIVKEADAKVTVGGVKSFKLRYEGGSAKGNIGNGRVYVLLPPDANVKALRPEYEVTKGYTCDLQQGAARDFGSPVRFSVTSPDGVVSRGYEVVVRQGKNSEAELFDFAIDGLPAPQVYGNTITFYGVPVSVDATRLTPRFSLSRGASASIAPGVPYSFKEPVQISVVSEDKSMRQIYTVVVEQQLNHEAELLSFRFKEFGEELQIAGNTVDFVPPAEVDVKRLTPLYTISAGAKANLENGVAADFSRPVRLTITSQDESTMKTYTIRCNVASRNLKYDFESWKSKGSDNLAYEQPAGAWSSGNEGVKVSKKTIGRPERFPLRKTTDAHSGKYAAEMVTELVNNNLLVKVRIAAGSLFMGSFNASNIILDPLSGPQFGIPYDGELPARLQGWYKYQPGGDNLDNDGNPIGKPDECDIYAILYTGNTITAKDIKDNPRIIARAQLKDRSAKSEWTKFDEAFEYYREPKANEELKFSIVMTSSVDGDKYTGAVGSRLVVDDLEVVLR